MGYNLLDRDDEERERFAVRLLAAFLWLMFVAVVVGPRLRFAWR
jgi:hypothetical protein